MRTFSWHTGDVFWDGFGYKVEDGEPWEFERKWKPCRKGRWRTLDYRRGHMVEPVDGRCG